MTKNTGKAAFPTIGACHGDDTGMTLRDHFAGLAMQGILYEDLDPPETAKHAYEMADAMLKAREA
jgi:hypothetical protein